MTNWFRQHRYALGAALVHLRRSPGGFLFNILVVAIALALPFAGVTLLDNVRPMSEQLSVDPEISVFMKQDTPREQARRWPALRQAVKDKQAKIIFTPREKALDHLKDKNGLADVLATLGDNPLPDSYVLKLDAFRNAQAGGDVDELAEQIRSLPGVDPCKSIRPGSSAWPRCSMCCGWPCCFWRPRWARWWWP
jgi:cell division transport system permease protein